MHGTRKHYFKQGNPDSEREIEYVLISRSSPLTVKCVCSGGNKYGKARKLERGLKEVLFCGCDKTPSPWQLTEGRVYLDLWPYRHKSPQKWGSSHHGRWRSKLRDRILSLTQNESKLGMTLKPDILFPARPHLVSIPKHQHQRGQSIQTSVPLGTFEAQMKFWVNVYYWCGHNHVRDPHSQMKLMDMAHLFPDWSMNIERLYQTRQSQLPLPGWQ